jgi:hypothetical protein
MNYQVFEKKNKIHPNIIEIFFYILAKNNIIERLKLYIDLVSDLMFNFHMVHCLNLRTKVSTKNSSNYAYIYSHRPTYKVRSTFRDQVKLFPQAIGHFAELGKKKKQMIIK